MTGFNYEKDADNIVTITMDMPGQAVNTMSADYEKYMQETLDRLDGEIDEVAGIIFASAKKTFFAGGEIDNCNDNLLIKATKILCICPL